MSQDCAKKTRALILIRSLVVTILFGSLYLIEGDYERFVNPDAISYVIASVYFVTIIYALTLRLIKNFVAFTYVQIIFDTLIGTLIVALTGGVKSFFSFILFLSVISASIMLSRRASYIIAFSCTILFSLMALFQSHQLLPTYIKDIAIPLKEYVYYSFVHINALFLVAYLSSYPGENLKRVILSLRERDIDIDVLRAFNQDVLDNVPCGLFSIDVNGRIVVFNKAARKITHMTLSEVIGKKPIEIFPFINKINPDSWRIEGDILCGGKVKTIGMSFSGVTQRDGTQSGIIGIFQDLTLLRKMEQEVRKKEKLAAIGELSAAIAHELRNPLASLKGATEMLREGKVTPEQGKRLMDIALKEMDRLNNIVTDFLLYAKPIKLNQEKFDINELLKEMIYLIKNRNVSKDMIEVLDTLPGTYTINGDQEKLRQVFWNLSKNALEAMPQGGKFQIKTKKLDDKEIQIDFTDTGSGISQQAKDKIFYPFFTTKSQGSGLGLAISKRITEEHSGKISFTSNENTGTTFSVVLPLNK
jgi:two-component system sensor histidine kinase PilS (NtrC family)